MQSFLSAASRESGDQTKMNTTNDPNFGEKFVACIDVVGKIKTLSQLKTKLGNVPHTYSVPKTEYWKKPENSEKSGIFSDSQASLRLRGLDSQKKLQILRESTKAVYQLKEGKIEKEFKKEKAFRVGSQGLSYSTRNLIGSQLDHLSMANVVDPDQRTAERSIALLRKPVIESKPLVEILPLSNLREAVASLKSGMRPRLPGIRPITDRPIQSSEGISRPDEAEDSQIHGFKPPSTSRNTHRVRRSFLIRVEQANQIDKSNLVNETSSKDLEKFKVGNLISEETADQFTDFLNYFDRYASMFQSFRVKGLQDYTAHPLEQYDTYLDPTLDVEYFLQKNTKAKSRWVKANGKFDWRPCTVTSYNKENRTFDIVFEDGEKNTKKTVTRMNLIFEGEDERFLEERRVKANVVRCLQLLELSFQNRLLNKDVLERCKVFFSFPAFKRILEESRIGLQTINQSDFLSNYLLETFDEYALAILRFFVHFKTSEDLDGFVNLCE